VTSEKNNVIEKSFSNLPGVKTITVSYLNPVDVLHATTMIVV
jgi:ribosomal protein L4